MPLASARRTRYNKRVHQPGGCAAGKANLGGGGRSGRAGLAGESLPQGSLQAGRGAAAGLLRPILYDTPGPNRRKTRPVHRLEILAISAHRSLTGPLALSS